MWISIEDELPRMLAKDLINGGTTIKIKHPDFGEGTSIVADHNTWYFHMKSYGVTHWWKD